MSGRMRLSVIWKESWNNMKGNWGILTGITLCHNLILAGAQNFLGVLAHVLLAPMTAGCSLSFLSVQRRKEINFSILFSKFDDYGRFVWGVTRSMLFTLLWGLLFIIPGIIAALRYSQTVMLMLDDPSLDAAGAMKKSAELMKGYKLRLFFYWFLWFWILVTIAICTLSIGLIWAVPFSGCFFAKFYLSLREVHGLPVDAVSEEIRSEITEKQD